MLLPDDKRGSFDTPCGRKTFEESCFFFSASALIKSSAKSKSTVLPEGVLTAFESSKPLVFCAPLLSIFCAPLLSILLSIMTKFSFAAEALSPDGCNGFSWASPNSVARHPCLETDDFSSDPEIFFRADGLGTKTDSKFFRVSSCGIFCGAS